jgi:hypothetical protein
MTVIVTVKGDDDNDNTLLGGQVEKKTKREKDGTEGWSQLSQSTAREGKESDCDRDVAWQRKAGGMRRTADSA